MLLFSGESNFDESEEPNRSLFFRSLQCPNFEPPIIQLCSDQVNFAVLLKKSILLNGSIKNFPEQLRCMAFYQRNPYVVDVNGIIYNLIPNEQVNVEINGLVRTIVGSSNRLFAITFDKSCYLIVEDSAIKLAENCKCVGATEENVFVSTNDGLFEVQDFDLKRIDFDKKIVSISCSETDAYFIDSDGLLYNFYNNKFIRVYGLPPIESVSVGEQHNAAIGRNKKLYTWGFNPSGQLGTRNDKSTNNPICILEDVSMVAVTNQATYVLKG